MSFEEDFPSVMEAIDEDTRGEDAWMQIIEDCCLDKERVKQAIDDLPDEIILTQHSTESDKWIMNTNFIKNKLKKELGLK